MRPPCRQIFHATATCVLHFAKSSTQPPHASSISPNLPRNRHTRPRFRQIFEGGGGTEEAHAGLASCPRFQLAVDIFQLPVEKDSGRRALSYRKSFGIVFGCRQPVGSAIAVYSSRNQAAKKSTGTCRSGLSLKPITI